MIKKAIMEGKKKKTAIIAFTVTIAAAILCMVISAVNARAYNHERHHEVFAGAELFSPTDSWEKSVSAAAVPRSSTWTKVYDPENLGLTEPNIQAYTYDFFISNKTKDAVAEFTFRLTFSRDVFLSSAWNGALEIHQNVGGEEIADIVPDLREYVPENHSLESVRIDGEVCIPMRAGDYLIYTPSATVSAREVPIEPYEGTVPGIILYTYVDAGIEDSSLELDYTFHRKLTSDPLFWISIVVAELWLVTLILYILGSARIRKFQERHERDNELIRESIETFTGFIDAKDSYTNGHSNRVAEYTRLIAQKFGYEGEELDRIFYIALLHDCGKIGVPDNILGKPGRLTAEEFQIVKSHTVRGGEILKSFKSLKDAEMGALYHHERYDGTGYPEGRAGEDIPFVARMICVADSFDAMNSNRVYRKQLTREKIISEIETNKGRQFDPKVADVMLGLLKDGTIVMEA